MSDAAAAPSRPSHRRITAIGLGLLALLAALVATSERWNARVQGAWFDVYQSVMPRAPSAEPVTVVDIDERSVARLGQWPWPRTLLAELIAAILQDQPAAVGVDILMAEPDRSSPEQLLARERARDFVLAQRLDALPSNDEELARAIWRKPVVLGFVEATALSKRLPEASPVLTIDVSKRAPGPDAGARMARLPGVLANVEVLDAAASGHGAMSIGPPEAVVRRVPLVMRLGEQVVPALAVELLRVARAAPYMRLYVDGADVEGVGAGDDVARTEGDGWLRIHYAPLDRARFVSAVDVLDDTSDKRRIKERIEDRLVLLGISGLALGDTHPTPVSASTPGIEIQAQLLENIKEHSWLVRPGWAMPAELASFIALGLVLIVVTPRLRAGHGASVAAGCIALPLVTGMTLFAARRLVLDAATPVLALVLLYVALLVLTLAESAQQRKRLEQAVQRQREEAARVAGELDAARRIQQGFLPRVESLRGDPRVDVAVSMTPARETGGDLYDFFPLDAGRLFFMVGDVAGKGLSASVFMAVSKALCKSARLRMPDAAIGDWMRAVNDEISRDNPAMLFVATFAGVLDLDEGQLAYCNAGHENPYVLGAAPAALAQLADGGGPPLCTVDRFAYRGALRRLRRGEIVCVLTDGVVDARRADGETYGRERLVAVLGRLAAEGTSAQGVVDAVATEVAAFAADAEPADDVTILVLRWLGPKGSSA
ncbi:MAG TPA: CHASE2 domain-containing protein [Casimicrobiaceae bacterium]|nr:CHASE2 domain-containing protein [Casimicrobiaceae bacterium]